MVKITFRLDDEISEQLDNEIDEDEDRSEVLRQQVDNYLSEQDDYSELERGLRIYLSGVVSRDPEVVARGIDDLYDFDESIGAAAEEYLEKLEQNW